ncbi:MAG TPA: PadR family transcriptional regulator [Novosphingobium sp.]|nr:PadR family transcriptional regulator [Novosphingobium sp.]
MRGGFFGGGGPFGGGPFGGGPFGDEFGGGRGGRGGGGGGRRAKRFDSEELRLLVLGELGEEPRHGYQLIRALAEKSADAYQPSPGVLYPLLTMLAEMGLVAEAEGQEGSTRRRYELTEAGRAELAANAERLAQLRARLAALAEQAGRIDGAPVRRAVHNLRAAIMERLGRAGTAEETAFAVAAIIDEAAQKIERL